MDSTLANCTSFLRTSRLGEAIAGYLLAVGIRLKMRMTERGAFVAYVSSEKARGLCGCSTALYGNAALRLSEVIPSDGAWAYGYPDIDALFKPQAVETDPLSTNICRA